MGEGGGGYLIHIPHYRFEAAGGKTLHCGSFPRDQMKGEQKKGFVTDQLLKKWRGKENMFGPRKNCIFGTDAPPKWSRGEKKRER